jgi:hypothetical protein
LAKNLKGNFQSDTICIEITNWVVEYLRVLYVKTLKKNTNRECM